MNEVMIKSKDYEKLSKALQSIGVKHDVENHHRGDGTKFLRVKVKPFSFRVDLKNE